MKCFVIVEYELYVILCMIVDSCNKDVFLNTFCDRDCTENSEYAIKYY